MTPRPHPRASWPSNDDTTGFNLIVILLGCGLGAYLLWINYHQAISAAAMALAHQEILLLGHFTNRFQLADRQMAAADPAGVTLLDLYGIVRAIGLFVRIPATAFILLLAAICTVRATPSRFKRAFDLDGCWWLWKSAQIWWRGECLSWIGLPAGGVRLVRMEPIIMPWRLLG